MATILGVDVGGTFTDFFLADTRTGVVRLHKAPSTPDNPARAIAEGIAYLSGQLPAGTHIDFVAHGTTVATNALLQGRGGTVALVSTQGFKDLIEIGRQTRPRIYDLQEDHPKPLVPRHRSFEVAERIGSHGQVVKDLCDAEIEALVARLREALLGQPAPSVAVCLLFSFLNPEHEKRIGAAIRAAMPECDVSLSCEIQPEFREYERLSTTVLNAFLQPEVGRYLARLQKALDERIGAVKIGICQSSGGLMSVARAAEMPIRTALSGPAAGVVGAIAAGKRSRVADIVTFDMGGTSTDVCLVRDGRAEMAFGRSVAGFPVRLPSIDIHTVGAGGGSIAHIGRDGLLKVGPESAGAVPGPACYGRGGVFATVSDANLVLGRLPRRLVGGGMSLDMTAAERAIASVGTQLGLGVREAALGIVAIVNSNMVRAIRAVSIERGYDPRGCALMPYGGAGGLHAVALARELSMRQILVPPAPGILCAEGVANSELEESFVATRRCPLNGDLTQVENEVSRLGGLARAWFAREDVPADAQHATLIVDMRYIGQNFELPVVCEIAGEPRLPAPGDLRRSFDELHQVKYGHHDGEAPVEIVNVRIVARASPLPADASSLTLVQSDTQDAIIEQEVWFDERNPILTRFVSRSSLRAGDVLHGPVIVTQFDATTLVEPGWRASVQENGNILIEAGS